MKDCWGRIGEKIRSLLQWFWENHPGKLLGTLLGFMLAVLFILLGFWQTVLLISLCLLGFYLGKCWDEGEVPAWLTKLLHRIPFKG